MKVSIKGTIKQLGTVPEASQKGFLAWLEGKYAPGKNVAFKDGKWPYLIDAKKGGYSPKQVRIH